MSPTTNPAKFVIILATLLLLLAVLVDATARATEELPHVTSLYLGVSIEQSEITLLGDVNGDGYSDVAIHPHNSMTIYFGSSTGLSNENTQLFVGQEAGENFAFTVSAAGDLNNDGFDDILVGAPDNGLQDNGRVYVYLGSSVGPILVEGYYAGGSEAGERFGARICNAGDLNNDGYDDVLIGAFSSLGWEVWPGCSTGLASSMNQFINLYGYSTVIPLGDFNADGYDDVYFRTGSSSNNPKIYFGSTNFLTSTPREITPDDIQECYRFHPAGDVNGDGYTDFVLGDGNAIYDTYDYRGAARLVAGNSSSYSYAWEQFGPVAHEQSNEATYGEQVASAGDFNGDGYGDFVISAPRYGENGSSLFGLIDLYLGGPSGPANEPDYQIVGNLFGDRIGEVLLCGGDINGDGYGDFIFTKNYDINMGQGLSIVFGRGETIAAASAAYYYGSASGDELGRCVSTAGDVNSDGFSDVAAGAYKYDSERGMVEVMVGGDGLFTNWTKIQLYGESSGDRFGYSVDYAGDVNGDGYSDLVVGAPNAGASGLGRVYIYPGSFSGLSTTAAWVLDSPLDGRDFGFSVAGAGDANGDGFADILVGDPNYRGDYYNQGRAALYLGSPEGLYSSPLWAWSPGISGDEAGYSVCFAGDTNGDGYSDILIGCPGNDGGGSLSGKALMFLGSRDIPDTYPDWSYTGGTAGGRVGMAVASAGDIDNNRCADILVGAPYQDNNYTNTGSAYLFLGSRTGLSIYSIQRFDGDGNTGVYLGSSLAGIGDVNGDGYGDVAISEDGRGRVRIYLGAQEHLDVNSLVYISNVDVPRFGSSIARAGDVNGDGFNDLIIGGPQAGEFLPNRGAYFIHLGNGKDDVANTLPYRPRQGIPGNHGVDLMGKLYSASEGAPISLQAFSPAGRGELRFVHRSCDLNIKLEHTNEVYESWDETHRHQDYGHFDNMWTYLAPVNEGSENHWQSRFETRSIYFPHSRWFSHPGTGQNMMHFRGAMDVPRPNLAVTEWSPSSFAGSGNVTVDFRAYNQGNFGAGDSYCSISVDGVEVVTNMPVGAIGAGEWLDLSANIGSLTTGTRRIRIDLDVTHVVQESDETDNDKTWYLNVTSLDYLFVQPDGNGDVATIADAVNTISPGGVVELASGVFTGAGNRDISINGKTLTIRSASGNPETCVLDAEGTQANPHRALNLANISSDNVQLQGITIRNGYNTYGGGIIMNDASPRLVDCIIEDCAGMAGGGILAVTNSQPVFENCKFLNNTTTDSGGAVGLNGSDASFYDCWFESNFATYGGGAVYQYSSGGNYRYCVFIGNSSNSMGGGVHATQVDSHMGFVNCTFYGNHAPSGGHLYSRVGGTAGLLSCILQSTSGEGAAFFSNAGGEVTAANNNVALSSGGDYVSGLAGLNGVNDNFSAITGFCSPTEGNFHLETDSPCIDHGSYGQVGAFPAGCGLEYVVNPDGSGDFPTIQAAVDAAGLRDVILLGNGTFTGEGNRDISITNEFITIRSQWGDSTACIIDCQGDETNQHQGLSLNSTGSNVILEHFTITGGYTSTLSGGALNLMSSSPKLEGMIFKDNVAFNGGAIYSGASSFPWINNCIFDNNYADNAGGAISLHTSGGDYDSCHFEGNYGKWGGGAIYLYGSSPEVTNSLFVNNRSDHWGGAVHGQLAQTNATFWNNTFDGNSAETGGIFYLRENAVIGLGLSILTNSTQGEAVYVKTGGNLIVFGDFLDVFNNAEGDYVEGLASVAGLPGSLSVDPLYCGADVGIYTLDVSSPCLAANSDCSYDLGAFAAGCAVSAVEDNDIPDTLFLGGNYPNPFNPQTNIVFGLPSEEMVGLTIYSISGQVVRRLLSGEVHAAGFHEMLWDGCDGRGRSVSSGVYFYRVQAGTMDKTGKMALIR